MGWREAVMGAQVAAVSGRDALLCVRRPSQCGTYGPGAAAVPGSTDHSGRHGSGSAAGADHHQAGQRRTAAHTQHARTPMAAPHRTMHARHGAAPGF